MNVSQIRPLAKQAHQELFDDWSELAERNVEFGTQVLDWCMKEHPGSGVEGVYNKLPILTLLRHFVELHDLLPQMIRSRQIAGAEIIVRSMLDATFSLLFILKEDSQRRSEAYAFMDTLNGIIRRERQVPLSSGFDEYNLMHQKDILLGQRPATVAEDLDTLRLQNTAERKALEQMTNAHAEYARLEGLKGRDKPRYIEWYMFFSNIRSIRQMAIDVDLGATYDFFYTRYSGKIHPVDVISHSVEYDVNRQIFTILPLRSVKTKHSDKFAFEIIGVSTKCAELVYRRYLKIYLQEKLPDLDQWYDGYVAELNSIRDRSIVTDDTRE